jgi:hypothetical protein
VLPGLEAARQMLERFPAFVQKRFLVAIAAHGIPDADEERAPDLVVGRSMTEHPAA